MTPGAGPFLTPGAWLAGFIEDHYTLLHTKYESSGPCGFGEEDFLMFFPMTPPGLVVSENKIFICFSHCKSMGAICCHGNQNSDPTWPKT